MFETCVVTAKLEVAMKDGLYGVGLLTWSYPNLHRHHPMRMAIARGGIRYDWIEEIRNGEFMPWCLQSEAHVWNNWAKPLLECKFDEVAMMNQASVRLSAPPIPLRAEPTHRTRPNILPPRVEVMQVAPPHPPQLYPVDEVLLQQIMNIRAAEIMRVMPIPPAANLQLPPQPPPTQAPG